jgi:tetratricopeptide (TPR) repeat protein
VDEAAAHLLKALEIDPNYSQAHYNLGNAFLQKGRVDQAIVEFQKLAALQPRDAEPRRILAGIAWRLATSPDPSQRNGTKAVELARQTDQLSGGNNPTMAATLAAAYAESGEFGQAISAARRALNLATRQGNTALAASIEAQLKCYESGAAFREETKSP